MKTIMLLIGALLMLLQSATAVIQPDGSRKLIMPTEDRGQHSQGLINGYLSAIAVGSNWILTAEHTFADLPATFTLEGRSYTITNRVDSPDVPSAGMLRGVILWQVDGIIPKTNRVAGLYTNSLFGKTVTVFGHGVAMREPFIRPSAPLTIVNLSVGSVSNSITVVGGKAGARFVIEQSTNLQNWVTVSAEFLVLTDNEYISLLVKKPNCDNVNYRTKTVNMIAGWVNGLFDGQLSWGTEVIDQQFDANINCWWATFGRNGTNQSCNTTFDSSGGVFVLDSDGKYKLAAVVLGVGDFLTTSDYALVCMLDMGGFNGTPITVGEQPTSSAYTALPVQWMKSKTGAK